MAKRVDANQKSIVAALRKAGATVTHLHTVHKGCPDLLVGHKNKTYLMEVKVPGGALTPAQEIWHAEWRGQKAIVETIEEALMVIGVIK